MKKIITFVLAMTAGLTLIAQEKTINKDDIVKMYRLYHRSDKLFQQGITVKAERLAKAGYAIYNQIIYPGNKFIAAQDCPLRLSHEKDPSIYFVFYIACVGAMPPIQIDNEKIDKGELDRLEKIDNGYFTGTLIITKCDRATKDVYSIKAVVENVVHFKGEYTQKNDYDERAGE